MHSGKITNSATVEARLYRYMKAREGRWLDAWDLASAVKTRALSTYLSSVRQQIPRGWRLDNSFARIGGKRRDWYVLAAPSRKIPASPGERGTR